MLPAAYTVNTVTRRRALCHRFKSLRERREAARSHDELYNDSSSIAGVQLEEVLTRYTRKQTCRHRVPEPGGLSLGACGIFFCLCRYILGSDSSQTLSPIGH